ncbi:hypothetical protein [Nocardiopsis sp. NRRL B-16309]|uniref:hypothetical protein n=1 Tax=Nocardiopsis sp. NRRL B-16309 TaxID=1519494 RepID=UPI0006ADE8B3|nr:hypothetical protein [Nocardiopsis sp. NRRL B-16309]KOX13699.1 hypothetical protein ADL05_18650 [Nocardiopsis sp. NRRL B-16309]
MPVPETTVLDVLHKALEHQGLRPRFYDFRRENCVLVTAQDGTVIVINDPDGDNLHTPLSQYEGLLVCRYGHHVDPDDPGATDTEHERVVFSTPDSLRHAELPAVLADMAAMLRAVVAEAARPLEVPPVSTLLINALDPVGLTGEFTSLGGGTTGVYVDLRDGTHLLITDPEGTRIGYPAREHTGLLVCRYPDDDLGCWETVYDSRSTDAVRDVREAVTAITTAARSPLRT